jgi:multidrug resistance efflux pump
MTTDTLNGETSLRDRVQSLRLPQRADAPGRGGRAALLPWALTLLLALCTVSLAARVYGTRGPAGDAEGHAAVTGGPSSSAPTPGGLASPTATLSSQDPRPATAPGAVVLESKGYIIPAHQIQVSPIEVSGLVQELFIEEGKRFKKGDVLAVLDKTSFAADVQDARYSLDAAEQRFLELDRGYRKEEKEQALNDWKEAEEQLKKMYLDFKRAQELRGTGLSAQEYEQAEYAYRAQEQRVSRLKFAWDLMKMGPREERIAAAKADVEAAKARLRKAEWRLENCTIRAPVDGTILTKKAELGNLVNPLAFNASSGSVCEMADLSDLEVELDVTERDIAKVAKGMPCRIRAEAYPDRVYEGVVDRLMPIANRAKGALPVRVKVRVPKEEEGVYLRPEIGAVVAFLQPGKKN